MPDTRPLKSHKHIKYGVLLWNQRYSEKPHVFIDADSLTNLVECGFAERIGRQKWQLKKPLPLKLRDISASFGAKAMEALAGGSAHHRALLEAWA